MIFLKLLIVVCFYVECYLSYRISKNPFESEEYDDLIDFSDDNEFIGSETMDSMYRKLPFNPENDSQFWRTKGQQTVADHVARMNKVNVAKNVIYFIGDGMSLATVSAARIYSGQLKNERGEEGSLSFEKFPHIGLSKTYCIDKQVADSACSGTALMTGVKNNYQVIGVNGNVKLHDCAAAQNKLNHLSSFIQWAQNAGKATGIVTNAGITTATPAATYAHVASRKYECAVDVMKYQNNSQCENIAQQLIHHDPGKNLNVIFGGGRDKLVNYVGKEHKNLIKEWLQMKNDQGIYLSNRKELLSMQLSNNVKHVLGIFSGSSLPFNLHSDRSKYPTLTEMTLSAIKILESLSTTTGYVLMVEGGRIDHGHHHTRANLALDETVQLSEAVQQAVANVKIEETLVVVTSDHGHTMSFAGYNPRGGNILDFEERSRQKKPYTVLSYANGPGLSISSYTEAKKKMDSLKVNYKYPSTVSLGLETHGGDDVGVFAIGPWSHLFSGAYEQNVIAQLIAYAACIGDGMTACNANKLSSPRVQEVVKRKRSGCKRAEHV